MTTKPLKLCLLMIFGLTLLGCQTTLDPTGDYDLVAVNGQALPATITHGGTEVKVHSGWFKIEADGTCCCCSNFSTTSGDELIESVVNATYTQEDSTLTMQWEDAGRTIATLTGDTLTMDNEGLIFTYQREPVE